MGRGQGRPGLSLLNPDTNLEALSQICYPGSSSPPRPQLASLAVTPLLTQNGHSPRHCLRGNDTCGGTSLVVKDLHSLPAAWAGTWAQPPLWGSFSTPQSGGKVVLPPRMVVRVK